MGAIPSPTNDALAVQFSRYKLSLRMIIELSIQIGSKAHSQLIAIIVFSKI